MTALTAGLLGAAAFAALTLLAWCWWVLRSRPKPAPGFMCPICGWDGLTVSYYDGMRCECCGNATREETHLGIEGKRTRWIQSGCRFWASCACPEDYDGGAQLARLILSENGLLAKQRQ